MSDPETRRRRPWLAAALALLVSGLGHAYLRRWARAFGWYALITATLVFVVPDAAVDRVVAGERPPLVEIAPALIAVAASVVDAYVLAVRNNRAYERGSPATETAADASSSDRDGLTGSDAGAGSAEPVTDSTTDTVSCPHCGRDTDATLDFCQWCVESLDE
ncbi:zinc ribbon domain-containing protein [Halorubrum salsamenti]|uniref:zinc ribbon domain-containing protein n=1 Tax=Halorubrum salsamenti TaxID=2583990 RepID=UPI0011A09DDB|nr:zinc ribbon domain-containing protein [Halorubrum salsamenti]